MTATVIRIEIVYNAELTDKIKKTNINNKRQRLYRTKICMISHSIYNVQTDCFHRDNMDKNS